MKLTPWFEGKVKPVRPGVYQRVSHTGATVYARFEHGKWYAFRSGWEEAKNMKIVSGYQWHLQWRGIRK